MKINKTELITLIESVVNNKLNESTYDSNKVNGYSSAVVLYLDTDIDDELINNIKEIIEAVYNKEIMLQSMGNKLIIETEYEYDKDFNTIVLKELNLI
jgi:hypothetical protein